jgi:hypothetical protein
MSAWSETTHEELRAFLRAFAMAEGGKAVPSDERGAYRGADWWAGCVRYGDVGWMVTGALTCEGESRAFSVGVARRDGGALDYELQEWKKGATPTRLSGASDLVAWVREQRIVLLDRAAHRMKGKKATSLRCRHLRALLAPIAEAHRFGVDDVRAHAPRARRAHVVLLFERTRATLSAPLTDEKALGKWLMALPAVIAALRRIGPTARMTFRPRVPERQA